MPYCQIFCSTRLTPHSIALYCNAFIGSPPENIAHLAETALRFLELVQENNLNVEHDLNGEDTEEALHPNENYDSGNSRRPSSAAFTGLFSRTFTLQF